MLLRWSGPSFLLPSPPRGEGSKCSVTAATGSLAPDGRNFAGLGQLLEATQVFLDLVGGVGPEQPGQPTAEFATGWIVLEHDAHLGAAVARRLREMNRSRRRYLRTLQGTPGNQAVGLLIDDLGIPRNAHAGRPLGDPVRAAVLTDDRLEMTHEARQVLEVAPEAEHLVGRLADGDGANHLDAT